MSNQVVLGVGAAIVVVAAIFAGFFLSKQEECRDFSQGIVEVNNVTLHVAVATDALEQSRGLSGCTALPKDGGMYFSYSSKQTPSFWMKGMRIPIDIIWIADEQVVEILEYVPVPSNKLDQELPRYRPSRPVTAVLELNAGASRQLGITQGTPVQFTKTSK